MRPNCGVGEICGACLRCYTSARQRSECIDHRLLQEAMNDCIYYPPPSRDCVRNACALKTILLASGGRASVFYSDIANIVVRFLHPRVNQRHLLLPLQPEVTISRFSIPSFVEAQSYSLLCDYERRVLYNDRMEFYNEFGFIVIDRSQYENSVIDKEEARDQAKRKRERKKRGLLCLEGKEEPRPKKFPPSVGCLSL
jgi:hypothetical protein